MRNKKTSQGSGKQNPMDYILEISNQSSWNALAMEIYLLSGDSISGETLRAASAKGWCGLRKLRLTIGQTMAVSRLTGLGLDELYKLSRELKENNSHSEENESH